MKRSFAASLTFAIWSTCATFQSAAATDICLQGAANAEKNYRIPAYVLSALSLTESGKRVPLTNGKSAFRPWPWTINVEGKGFFFKNKADAIAAVEQHRANGKRSIDVGCMQINLRYHPKAFRSLEEAFDPIHNTRYAGKFLSDLKKETGSWPRAVERYHSATPQFFTVYRKKVAQNWEVARKIGGGKMNLAVFTPADQTSFAPAPEPIIYDPKSSRPPKDFDLYKKQRIEKIARIRALVRNNYNGDN